MLGTSKAKTVIYEKIGDSVIAVKHQHFIPENGTKIYYNYGKSNQRR